MTTTTSAPSSHETEVIQAPSNAAPHHPDNATLFLAGTTTMDSTPTLSSVIDGDWRGVLCARLAGRPLTIYDPRRPDWGIDWRNDAACAPFAEQTAWELARAEAADVVVFYFGAATDAPVSLLELGLAVGRRYGGERAGGTRGGSGSGAGAVVVCVDPAYRKRGNVQMVCQHYGVELVEGFDELEGAVVRSLDGLRQ